MEFITFLLIYVLYQAAKFTVQKCFSYHLRDIKLIWIVEKGLIF